ncbi:protein KASH5 isoform X4 [Heterocephalus glaber]|uniref:Protein KASH5 isoform X4 n=1 Tax=Heterocephalus glaber TaxID=10181 RepID=A0AAX6RZ43_HETGA|nr:protein KASH5 isoform X4 [Heterocephalus glaber]
MDLPESQAGGPAAEIYHREQPEDMSLGPLLSLEEQILNSTFEACDPQRTGTVAVTHVLAYLEAVTGQGPQDARLQTLAQSLDPNGEGPGATVDLDTFLVVMREWIAACQLHGGLELGEETAFEGALTSPQLPSGCLEAEEPANLESFGGEDPRPELPATTDLLSSLEDLELSNRRLAGENAKLQRCVETAEEGSARLGEEILALRRQLRSTQQALQSAKAVDEELEDLKTLAKSLEEQNQSLLAQARQTEKEQQHLVAEVETLQKENGKLLAERDGVKRRSEELATEKDALKRQLYECERLICQRDAVLSEHALHTESLAQTVEEYRATTRELRWEISHLEEQLSQAQEAPEELLEEAQARGASWTRPLPPSLGLEIKAIWQKQEVAGAKLSSPLCGVWQWGEITREPSEEAEFPSEAPGGGQRNSKGEPTCLEGLGKELSIWLPGREEEEAEEEAKSQLMADLTILLRDPHPGDIPGRSPERAAQHPLLPARVLGPVLLLLLLLLSVLLLGQALPPTWPHLQLCYLQPPPV